MRAEEDFVRGFHERDPGATARALARGRTPDGASSYAHLAAAVPSGSRTLDLGCGDGYLLERLAARGHDPARLVGLDVSSHELRAARARLPTVALLHARAQDLPLATASLDAVISHLAWTLMPDLERIVAELARVLAPGGRFVAVVGGGPKGDDAFAGLLDLARPVAAAAPPTPRLGDRRARTDAGLAALFAPATGFHPPRVDELTIDLSGTAAAVWDALSPSYELAHVDPTALAALRADFLAAAPQWQRPDGLVAATMYARLVTAPRCG